MLLQGAISYTTLPSLLFSTLCFLFTLALQVTANIVFLVYPLIFFLQTNLTGVWKCCRFSPLSLVCISHAFSAWVSLPAQGLVMSVLATGSCLQLHEKPAEPLPGCETAVDFSLIKNYYLT